MAMDEKLAEALAGITVTTSITLAMSELLLASADAAANTMTSLVRQSNAAAAVELATCARCVDEILRPRMPISVPKPLLSAAALSEREELIRLNAGAPVVT